MHANRWMRGLNGTTQPSMPPVPMFDEKDAKQRFQTLWEHRTSSVLACGFQEVRDAIVVQIFNGRRVTVYRSGLVELFGLITCQVRGIGQVARLPGARAEVRLTRALWSGKPRRRWCRRERGVEETVREQQRRRMKHENGKGEMDRYDMRTANTLSHACSCLYVTQGKKCKENVHATRSVCAHPVAHTVVLLPLRGCEILSLKKKNPQTSLIPCPLDFSHQDVGPPICHCVEFKSEMWFTAKYHFQLCENHISQSSFSESRSSR